MKVAFVRPNIFDDRLTSAMEVLCFAILRGLTPPDIETVLYDERLEPIPFDEPTDLVAMTVETFTARRAYQIADKFRQRGIPVVMGGFHPSMMPEESSLFADAVVIGDAEGVWSEILADAKTGRLKPVYRSADFPSMAGMKIDRSIFAGKRYAPLALVQWCRGCRFNCSFCSIRAFYGASLRRRPIRDMVEEIERLDTRNILFVDDNVFFDTDSAKELMRALIPLNLNWCCQISIDVARDPELLELMRLSGCMSALIGFESLEPQNLKLMKKGWNLKWCDYETSIKRLQDAGVMIYGTFVLGWDHDMPDVFDRTVEFAIRHKFTLGGFNPLMPTPGTKMYDQLLSDGRLIHPKWWVDPAYRYGDAVFKPRKMTVEQFTDGCYRARSAFSSRRSIIRRGLDFRTALRSPYRLFAHSLANKILREEVHRKQLESLGSKTDPDPYQKIQAAPILNEAIRV
jgi:radical SAM superfamily enzyme YgiQ (UPF0313 family)